MRNLQFSFLRILCYLYLITTLSSCSTALIVIGGVGAGAVAVNTIKKDQTIGSIIDDKVIASKIKKSFINEEFHNLYTKIYVSVLRGRVFLYGFVSDEKYMLEAVKIAAKQNGVVDVINEIKIEEDSDKTNLKQYAIDTAITSSIKTALLFTKSVKSANYEIFTHYNVVYVFGLAHSEEEMENVNDMIAETSGVEEVVSYISVSDEK
ncbi:MAG: BON domain-containing protein [Rickettsiaceae bacterium]|nr:BON domain-containing protein [Rickettsiaceae bacterium]